MSFRFPRLKGGGDSTRNGGNATNCSARQMAIVLVGMGQGHGHDWTHVCGLERRGQKEAKGVEEGRILLPVTVWMEY